MMRDKFGEQLETLNNMLIDMGALIELAIAQSAKALKERNVELAKKAIAFDEEVNQKEKDIETLCLKLLLQQQPVAKDLRLISTALKMITDMERIGDQAADIAEIVVMLGNAAYTGMLDRIPEMAAATIKMVTESIDAYVNKDTAMANAVIKYDDVVDDLFNSVRSDLIDQIREGSVDGEYAIDLMMIAKYFERIGDHAVNIAEWVLFSITGTHVSGQ